jgi:hypothetical protein
MAIFAELADGRRLEFPDGTDPAVIQRTVKRIVASETPPAEGVFAAGQGGLRRTFSPVHVLVSKQSLTPKVLPVVDLSVAKTLASGLPLAPVCNV